MTNAGDLNKSRSCSEKLQSRVVSLGVRREEKGLSKMILIPGDWANSCTFDKRDLRKRSRGGVEFSSGLVQFVGPLDDSYGEVF